MTFRMFKTGETPEDIEKWAEAEFPNVFKAVKKYLRDNYITAVAFDHGGRSAHVVNRAVRVGHMFSMGDDNDPVIAHITSENKVVLCEWAGASQGFCNAVGNHETKFKEPFCWLNPSTDGFGFARLKALVQFICSPLELAAGASIDVDRFKINFEDACEFIARSIEERKRQKGPAATPPTSQPTIAGPSLTSEPLPTTQKQKKPGDMEEFFASQKASFEEFVKTTQAAERQEKDRLLAETTELKQKLAKAEQECKDSKNELLRCDAKLEATLGKCDMVLKNCDAKLNTVKHAAEASRKDAEKYKKEARKVKDEVKKLTHEVEKLKKEAAESTQEATKAKRSLEDFQELEEVLERVQKRRVV